MCSILQIYFLLGLAESGLLLFEVAVVVCVQINITNASSSCYLKLRLLFAFKSILPTRQVQQNFITNSQFSPR